MEDKAGSGNAAVESGESNTPMLVKKPPKTKTRSQRVKSSHPPTSEMVTAAIKELKDRKGSSLQAIKKYISSTYKVDGEKFAPFIKKYLKSAVTAGTVVQTKGKGASGSFKLSTGKPETSKTKKEIRSPRKVEPKKAQSVEKKTVAKKTAASVKKSPAKKPAEKKAVAVKKTAAKAAATKAKAATEAKSMSKSRKTAKAPAAKTRTPKPKKAAASKSVKSPAKK
ncbi:histone H1B-like [Colletes gigas]|uniref:histone H1B-like n=1 Tax=Colletes gigas TaxID=935657 RepID=UPI001C9B0747|nr:histone H1B-like [Colletes gigas]